LRPMGAETRPVERSWLLASRRLRPDDCHRSDRYKTPRSSPDHIHGSRITADAYSPNIENSDLVNSRPKKGHHSVPGSAHIASSARCIRTPIASSIHCFRRCPRVVARSTTTIRADPKMRLWDQRRGACHDVHISAPIGVSMRLGRRAPAARNRRSMASSRKAYRTNAIVAPMCQKNTRQPTKMARQ